MARSSMVYVRKSPIRTSFQRAPKPCHGACWTCLVPSLYARFSPPARALSKQLPTACKATFLISCHTEAMNPQHSRKLQTQTAGKVR